VDILARSGNVIIKKERADTLHKSTGYRLCVLASGSLITDIFNSRIVIMVSCLHLGQNRGKFFNMGIGFNQPTTKYAQKVGPREIFWTGRGVE
jgi:hypothetical protein